MPMTVVKRYAADTPEKRRALELHKAGKSGTTLFGCGDNSPERLWNMAKLWVHYVVDFNQYFGKKDLS